MMRRTVWFLLMGLAFVLLLGVPRVAAAPSQLQATTPPVTGTPSGPVVYVPDRVNVRAGPSATDYERIGVLIAGQRAPALGRSPGGEWIKIAYPGVPGDVGWVYSPLVQIQPVSATLPIVEPPATPTPRVTATIDPTLAAQFIELEQLATRPPTFTPAQPVIQPTYGPAVAEAANRFPPILAILGLAVVGFFGLVVSVLRGR